MDHLRINRLSTHYPLLLQHVLSLGEEVPSRNGSTREVLGLSLEMREPHHCVIDRAGFSRSFMEAEIAMLLAGTYDHDLVNAISARASELLSPTTAYGPRIAEQLLDVENELLADPGSRRAVVYVGRQDDLKSVNDPDRKGEMPCTLTWQFLVRQQHLYMLVNMRSWDLVWGLSYDVPCFVAVQMALAKSLGCKLGTYLHVAGSAHVYQRHWKLKADPNPDGGKLWVPYLEDTLADTMVAAGDRLATIREEWL